MSTPGFNLVLTEEHQNLLLDALYAKSAETFNYLKSYCDDDQPGELDTCCPGHLARFEHRHSMRETLLHKKMLLEELINMIQQATFDQVPDSTTEGSVAGVDQFTLVYRDEDGTEYNQPLADITAVGTLIHPEDGEDLELSHVLLAPARSQPEPRYEWDNSISRELAGTLLDRKDEASVDAAAWLQEHENNDELWKVIGGLLDRITEMAAAAKKR